MRYGNQEANSRKRAEKQELAAKGRKKRKEKSVGCPA
jgi:hypothetical protein